jgi:hypothetical protein
VDAAALHTLKALSVLEGLLLAKSGAFESIHPPKKNRVVTALQQNDDPYSGPRSFQLYKITIYDNSICNLV